MSISSVNLNFRILAIPWKETPFSSWSRNWVLSCFVLFSFATNWWCPVCLIVCLFGRQLFSCWSSKRVLSSLVSPWPAAFLLRPVVSPPSPNSYSHSQSTEKAISLAAQQSELHYLSMAKPGNVLHSPLCEITWQSCMAQSQLFFYLYLYLLPLPEPNIELIVPSSNARKGLIGCSVQAKDKKQTVIRKIIQMYWIGFYQ